MQTGATVEAQLQSAVALSGAGGGSSGSGCGKGDSGLRFGREKMK